VLAALVRNTPNADNALAYAELLRNSAVRRSLKEIGAGKSTTGEDLAASVERELARLKMGRPSTLSLRGFTAAEILAPIAAEQFLLPGIPEASYTLIAGALSSFKTTLLVYLLAWKATGWDILGLDEHGNGCDMGRCVLATYEDTDARVFAKLQRVIQAGHRQIGQQYGKRDADQFVDRAAANIRCLPLMGQSDRGIVRRSAGIIVPNVEFIDRFLEKTAAFAPDGALIGLDPLRLAISGSQSDDDGADIAVHALNDIATRNPHCALVACSHSTKAGAQEPGAGYAAAAYATSGSALFSQHARSNFLMARLKDTEIRELFDPADVNAAEVKAQAVVRLTHGRLSHGIERPDVYLVMRNGLLARVEPRGAKTAAEVVTTAATFVIPALDRLRGTGVRLSATTLETDEALVAQIGGARKVRRAVQLLLHNGHLESAGTTRDRDLVVTESGRALVPGANRRERPGEGQS
jgi:hypothetical protein